MGACASKEDTKPSLPTLLGGADNHLPYDKKEHELEVPEISAWISMVPSLDIEGLTSCHLLTASKFEISYGDSTLRFPCVGELPELTPAQTAACPNLKIEGLPSDLHRCVVILTDPDAPSKDEPFFREFIHMVAIGVPVTADGQLQLKEGNVVIPYVGPAPPYNTGLHRYIFLVYAQPASDPAAGLLAALGERGGKRAAKTAIEFGLGYPLTFGGYLAKWDDSCDAAHEALGFVPPAKWRSPKQIAQHGSS